MRGRFADWRLATDRRGSVMIEFAILGPIVITLMLGVFQIGMAMQAYNALRGASSDLARYAAVQRQQGATVDATSLSTKARTIATAAPYQLMSANLTTASVSKVTTRITGADEYSVTYSYNVPNVLKIIGLGTIPLSYSRPIFVLT